MQAEEVLKQCKITGCVVALPDLQLDRSVYQEVAKKIELIGGKWNRSAKGFVFKQDPAELFEVIKNGENKNIKKEYQFFATPSALADKIACYLPLDVGTVLEPSAGQGALVQAINRLNPTIRVYYCELMELNRKQFVGEAGFLQDDFLTLPTAVTFDAVVANPPFTKNQDIDHFLKMFEHAEKTVISVMSNHWRTCQNKKESQFREFLEGFDTQIVDIPAGTFKESGTNISACLVILRK